MDALFEMAETPKTKSNEYYTPVKYIEAARQVMGGIDLDPASCEEANRVVRATKYYTREQNGLAQPWYGKVWCNPPFTILDDRSGMPKWTQKIRHEYEEKGTIEQAIVLAPTIMEKKWFRELWNYPICFVSISVHYHKKNSKALVGIGHGTCFAYLGPNEARFIDIFSQFGDVAKRVSSPQTKLQPDLWSAALLPSGEEQEQQKGA